MQERLLQVLISPHISEKSTVAAEMADQHTFDVLLDATKLEIKNAVEKLFSVKVRSVRTLRVSGKKVRFGRRQGQRRDWKKAIVRLQEGHDIDFTGGAN